MVYEEKLDLILKAIIEARKLARKGHLPKLYISAENKLNQLSYEDVYAVLLKLQDDEEILTISDKPKRLKSLSEQISVDLMSEADVNCFILEPAPTFDQWHERYILERKSKLENLDWINLLKAYDVALDINQQLQVENSTTLFIPSLPSMVRFPLLFPSDNSREQNLVLLEHHVATHIAKLLLFFGSLLSWIVQQFPPYLTLQQI